MPTERKTKQQKGSEQAEYKIESPGVVRSVWLIWQTDVALVWCWGLDQSLVCGLFCIQAAMAGIA